jgi:hypothetical protein
MTIPKDFWDRVETQDLKYIVYGDTDSLYLSIPEIQCDTAEEAVTASEEVGEEINDLIINCMNELVLPKMNCEGHNETFFKTELVMNAILFTDVKKKYCFREIAREGKIHKEPKIEYTGISVVRSNTAKWTKDFIREIVADLALNTKINGKVEVKKKLAEIALKYHTSLNEKISNFEFNDIGVPCKWSSTKYKRDTAELIGMKLYNTIFKEEYFKENTNGLKLPIKIKNPNTFLQQIEPLRNQNDFCIKSTPVDKLSFIVIPTYHERSKIEPILEEFGMTIDLDIAWEKLVDTALDRIIKCIKEAHGLPK